jgi:hypothetical protein
MQAVGVRREAEVTTVDVPVRAACVLEATDGRGRYSQPRWLTAFGP